MPAPCTLADSLRDVYRYYLSGLTDDHQAKLWARDWSAIERSILTILGRIDPPAVTWVDEDGPGDDTPFKIACIHYPDGRAPQLHFVSATADEAFGLPLAQDFMPDGKSIA